MSELEVLFDLFGLSNAAAARLFGVDESRVRAWRAGRAKCPDAVTLWCSMLKSWLDECPAPSGRLRRRDGG